MGEILDLIESVSEGFPTYFLFLFIDLLRIRNIVGGGGKVVYKHIF